MQLRMARAADRLQAAGDRDAVVELLCFQQSIVRRVEIVPLNVKTGERQTMPRRFRRVLVRGGDFAQPLAERD